MAKSEKVVRLSDFINQALDKNPSITQHELYKLCLSGFKGKADCMNDLGKFASYARKVRFHHPKAGTTEWTRLTKSGSEKTTKSSKTSKSSKAITQAKTNGSIQEPRKVTRKPVVVLSSKPKTNGVKAE